MGLQKSDLKERAEETLKQADKIDCRYEVSFLGILEGFSLKMIIEYRILKDCYVSNIFTESLSRQMRLLRELKN